MEKMLKELEKQFLQKKNTVFVIITEVSKGTPRKAGACMLVGEEGRLEGTIGGGNVEYQAIGTAQELLNSGGHLCKDYVMRPDMQGNSEYVCGGDAKIVFHCMKADSRETENFVKKGLAMYCAKTSFWMAIPEGEGEAAVWDRAEYQRYRETSETETGKYYIGRFLHEGKVYIFGGGHVAYELVPVLTRMDFRCVIADDREEYANPERFPDAEETLLVEYGHLERYIHIKKEDYVVVMTRGHHWDAVCEQFALGTEACYIGVMGSKSKAKYVREKMKTEGFSDEQLDRVTTPIGLSIGSETPQEIAVSIAAQMIQVRAEIRKEMETGK